MATSARDAAIIFCAGAALGAGTIFYLNRRQKRQKCEEENALGSGAAGNGYSAAIQLQPLSTQPLPPGDGSIVEEFEKDDVLAEQLTRNVQFFGLEGQKKIAKSFVVVVGLGVSLSLTSFFGRQSYIT